MWNLKFLFSENVSLTISSLFGRGGMRLICSALLASVLVAPVAHAQEPNGDEKELEEIVVTATRVPTPLADTLSTTQIITAEEIERTKPKDLGDLLRRKSGIGFRDSGGRGSNGGLFVRGTATNQTVILIDGIRTSSATNGATAFERIPLDSIERIEIIKGPMSGVYGADAVGGVIQIFTKQYQEMGSFGTIKTTAGTNKFRKYNARVGYGEESYSFSASVLKESTDGIDRTEYKGEIDDFGEFRSGGDEDRDGFEQIAGDFSLSIHPQDDLTVQIAHVQSSARVDYDNTSTSKPTIRCDDQKNSPIKEIDCTGDPTQKVDSPPQIIKVSPCPNWRLTTDEKTLPEDKKPKCIKLTSPTNRIYVGKDWHQKVKLNTTSVRFDYEQSDSFNINGLFGTTKDQITDYTPGGSKDRSHFNTQKSDFSVQANVILSTQNQVSLGIDYQNDKVDSTTSYEKSKRTNRGIFALWQYQSDQSSTVLNARHDRNSAYGSISNYSLQQSFDLNDEYKFIVSYGTAFKAPTFNELYWPEDGNPDLSPEESKSFEISLRASLDDLLWQVNAFQTKITNLISGWPPKNIKKSTQRGVEVEVAREWDEYIFSTSLDYLDAKDDSSGKFLEDRARVSGSIELGKQIDNFYVGVDAFFEHARFDRGSFLPGYALWGLHANYEISESLLISGKVDNLFDKKYVTNRTFSRDNYQNEGRTVQISVEYKF